MTTLFAFIPIMVIQTHFKGQTYYKVNFIVFHLYKFELSDLVTSNIGFLGRYMPWERDLTKHTSGVTCFETLSSAHATRVVSC
jgi:hypothetical protein